MLMETSPTQDCLAVIVGLAQWALRTWVIHF
jgi:hypothetical protein